MNLYQVTFDGDPKWVEAENFTKAIHLWREFCKEDWDEYTGHEQPDSVTLVHHEPVIRKRPVEELGFWLGDLVEIVKPDKVSSGQGVITAISDDPEDPFMVKATRVHNDSEEWAGWFGVKDLKMVARRGCHRKYPGCEA